MLVVIGLLIAALSHYSAPTPASASPLIRATPSPPAPMWRVKPPHKGAEMVNLGEVFAEQNYPFWALRYADEGRLKYRVLVDMAGRPVACEITEPAEAESLNQPTCDLVMAQARFIPATDRRGRGMATVYTRRVVWQLENRDPWPVTDNYLRLVISLDASGAAQCRTEASAGAHNDPRSCDAFRTSPLVAELLASARADPDAAKRAAWNLVIEESQFGGEGSAKRAGEVGSRPGERLNDRAISRVTLDAAGVPKGCEIVEAGNNSEQTLLLLCERTEKVLFAPGGDGRDRKVTLVGAVYSRDR